jgi:hypothetical protein
MAELGEDDRHGETEHREACERRQKNPNHQLSPAQTPVDKPGDKTHERFDTFPMFCKRSFGVKSGPFCSVRNSSEC